MISSKTIIFKIFKAIKSHFFFLLLLSIIMALVFYPVLQIAFDEWDWMELEYYIKVIPHHMDPILFWTRFYFTDQYGTIYALTGILELILRWSMTGYFVVNVLLRLVAAISIYLFGTWWSGKKMIGFVASLFFAVAVSGIENTIWVALFYAYIAVVLLIVSLYFWKRFHEKPSMKRLKWSVLFFALALFLAHTRLHFLPVIFIVGEIYYFLKKPKKEKYGKIRLYHLFGLVGSFLLLLFSSSSLQITTQVFKTVSPFIILKALVFGYPPIIHSFFLFLGNLIIPATLLAFLSPSIRNVIDLGNVGNIAFFFSFIGILFVINALIHKKYIAMCFALLAAIYPLSLYYSRSRLPLWDSDQLVCAAIGGTLFFLLLYFIIMINKNVPKVKELGWVAVVLMISHLIMPWVAYPEMESNIQSAYPSIHRYYTVPMVGMSLLWGILFFYVWEYFLKPRFSLKKQQKINTPLFLKSVGAVCIIMLLLTLFVSESITTKATLVERAKWIDKNREQQLWQMIRPIFANLDDRQNEYVVYVEGDLSASDQSIITYLLRHHVINELGYGRPDNKYTITFVTDKKIVKKLLKKDPAVYQSYNLPVYFSQDEFMAYRFTKSGLKDIKKEVVQDIKNQTN